MQSINVGELKLVVVKTSESLYVLSSEGYYEDNKDVFRKLSYTSDVYMSDTYVHVYASLNSPTVKALFTTRTPSSLFNQATIMYGMTSSNSDVLYRMGCSQLTEAASSIKNKPQHPYLPYQRQKKSEIDYVSSVPANPKEVENTLAIYKALDDLSSKVLGHLPKHYLDLPCVRIVLDNTTKGMTPEEILSHVVTNNQSLINIGIVRMTWDKNENGDVVNQKYKFKTYAAFYEDLFKIQRSLQVEIKENGWDTKYGFKVQQAMHACYVSDDPKNTSALSLTTSTHSIDSFMTKLNKDVSALTDYARAWFSKGVLSSTKATTYKVITVDGWDIVAAYQLLESNSCMRGRIEGYEEWCVETYANSGSCSCALLITADKEQEVLDALKLAHSRTSNYRDVDDYCLEIHARCMVWKMTTPEGERRYDRMYVGSHHAIRQQRTIKGVFASLLEADGIKPQRTIGDVIMDGDGAAVTLSPISGPWDSDGMVAIPYMDSFDYGYAQPNGDILCVTPSLAVKSNGRISVKASGGLTELCRTPCRYCGENVAEDDQHYIDLVSGTRDYMVCEYCLENDFVQLDPDQYGSEIYALSRNAWYCEETETYFEEGDTPEGYIEIDGEWVEEDSEQAKEWLAKRDAESANVIDMVSALYDPEDLRRRQLTPKSECYYDAERNIWIRNDIRERVERRRSLAEPSNLDQELIEALQSVDRAMNRLGSNVMYFASPTSVVGDIDVWHDCANRRDVVQLDDGTILYITDGGVL